MPDVFLLSAVVGHPCPTCWVSGCIGGGVECEPQARTRFWVGNGVGGKAMRPFLDDASWGAFGKSFSCAV